VRCLQLRHDRAALLFWRLPQQLRQFRHVGRNPPHLVTTVILFDDLVGSDEQSRRNFEAKRLRSFLVDP